MYHDGDTGGEVVDHQIAETVICVDKRMSYNGVAKVLAGDAEALEAIGSLSR